MDAHRVIEELLAIPRQETPFASVYLDVSRNDEHQREATRVHLRDAIRRTVKGARTPQEVKALALAFEPVEEYVASVLRQRTDAGARGLALFSCPGGAIFRSIAARVPFREELSVASRACILPFILACEALPPILIAAIESDGAWLFEMDTGEVEVEARLDRSFPGSHRQGGWAPQRIAHHIGELRERNLRAVVQRLVELAGAAPRARIVLAGQGPTVKHFQAMLPTRLLERVARGGIPYPSGLEGGPLKDALFDAARALLEEERRGENRRERDRALALAPIGLCALEVHQTLMALAEGKVQHLFLDADLRGTGWECQTCLAPGAGAESRCDYCGGTRTPIPLPELLVRRAYEARAEVTLLSGDEQLPRGVSVAATLRAQPKEAGAQRERAAQEQPLVAPQFTHL